MDIIDAQQTFTINLAIPEGFAEITNINAPSNAYEGDTVNMEITIANAGGSDTMFVSLESPGVTFSPSSRQEAYIESGVTSSFSFSFVMPASSVNIDVSAGHVE